MRKYVIVGFVLGHAICCYDGSNNEPAPAQPVAQVPPQLKGGGAIPWPAPVKVCVLPELDLPKGYEDCGAWFAYCTVNTCSESAVEKFVIPDPHRTPEDIRQGAFALWCTAYAMNYGRHPEAPCPTEEQPIK